MTIGWNSALLNARLQLLCTAIDAGGGPGKIRIYDSTGAARPATPGGAVTTQVLLLEQLFPYPSYDSITGSVMTINDPVPSLVLADGTPTWGRILTSANVFVLDGDVGLLLSGKEFMFNSVTWYTGGGVTFNPSNLTEL